MFVFYFWVDKHETCAYSLIVGANRTREHLCWEFVWDIVNASHRVAKMCEQGNTTFIVDHTCFGKTSQHFELEISLRNCAWITSGNLCFRFLAGMTENRRTPKKILHDHLHRSCLLPFFLRFLLVFLHFEACSSYVVIWST